MNRRWLPIVVAFAFLAFVIVEMIIIPIAKGSA